MANEVTPVLEQNESILNPIKKNESILATCTINSTQSHVNITWNVGSLKNTVRTVTNPPENSGGTSMITSYLIGPPPRDALEWEVQCVATGPNMDTKIINYTLGTTCESDYCYRVPRAEDAQEWPLALQRVKCEKLLKNSLWNQIQTSCPVWHKMLPVLLMGVDVDRKRQQ